MTALTSSPFTNVKETLAASASLGSLWRRVTTFGASPMPKSARSVRDIIAPISLPLFLQATAPREIRNAESLLDAIGRDPLKIWFRLSFVVAWMAYLGTRMDAPLRTPWFIGTGLFALFCLGLGRFITRRRVRTVEMLLRNGEPRSGRVTRYGWFDKVPWFIVEFRDRAGIKHHAKVTYHLPPGYYNPGAPAIVLYDERDAHRAAVIVRAKGANLGLRAFPAAMI